MPLIAGYLNCISVDLCLLSLAFPITFEAAELLRFYLQCFVSKDMKEVQMT